MTHDVDALLSRLGIARNPVPTAGTAADDASPESASQAAPRPAAPAKPAIPPTSGEPFWPRAPKSLAEAGLRETEVDDLILKYLYNVIAERGYRIAEQVGLRFPIVEELLRKLKADRLIYYKNSLPGGDYVYELTEAGRDRAFRLSKQSTYFGTAPVSLEQYIASVRAQSISDRKPPLQDIRRAFGDLSIPEDLLSSVGEAIHSGRGMFLFGNAGNGKTSIAERVTKAFGDTIWVPKAIAASGEIIRLYDPNRHVAVEQDLPTEDRIDGRWIKIERPTIVAGGELQMHNLEVTHIHGTGIGEAPLQLKANCGTMLIDDFGRQRMPVDELLNRWIVPLEHRHDFLQLASGRSIQVPFEELVILSTNLEPRDLVEEAFLRRIPYKIEVCDPTEDAFRSLFLSQASKEGFECTEEMVEYLIDTHFRQAKRGMRFCYVRDLLRQMENRCTLHGMPRVVNQDLVDAAVKNYFSIM
ncbi:AAA family ATPase [Maioricimonas sp. JC845]|uniref:AAA family ATPase n=1 Tax=Maioricimonas sp. JC845 TaxID=3232138 RepID=UPI00345AD8DE